MKHTLTRSVCLTTCEQTKWFFWVSTIIQANTILILCIYLLYIFLHLAGNVIKSNWIVFLVLANFIYFRIYNLYSKNYFFLNCTRHNSPLIFCWVFICTICWTTYMDILCVRFLFVLLDFVSASFYCQKKFCLLKYFNIFKVLVLNKNAVGKYTADGILGYGLWCM